MASNELRSNPSASSRRGEPGAGSVHRATTVSTREAAAALGISEQAVRQAIARGALAASKRRRAYRIRQDELDRYAQRRGLHPGQPRGKLVALPTPAAAPPLPTPATRFVGREPDLAALLAVLDDRAERVVTLTGPGGVGKTRLALAAAATVGGRLPDGVHFVDLAPVNRPQMVIPAVAQAVGLREQSGRDPGAQLAAFLRGKRALLVLDNFEQLLEAAPDVAWIAAQAPDASMLITSRAPLRIGGERVLPVPPLSLAGAAATPDDVLASDAGRLFVERARGHDPGFALDAESTPLIADICSRLDGLPLAIELAAARSRVLPPRQLRDRLERRLPLLTHGARDAPARQRAMRDAIAWSYDLLAPHEQRSLRRLAVFAGGCTLEAAAAVLRPDAGDSEDPATDVLETIGALVDQSLLVRELNPDGEPRFRMLETIREFALERLEAAEAAAARVAHADFFLESARALRPWALVHVTRGPVARMTADNENLRAALDWLDEHGPAADFVGLVAPCWPYWRSAGRVREAQAWLDRAWVKRDAASPVDRARLTLAFAVLLMERGELTRAAARFDDCLVFFDATSHPFDGWVARNMRGVLETYRGNLEEAERFLRGALRDAEAVTDAGLRAAVRSFSTVNLGIVARERGDFDLAEARAEEALRVIAGFHFELLEARLEVDLADLARARGDFRQMASRYRAGLERAGEEFERHWVSEVLSGIAVAATSWGQHRAAAQLFGAAAAMREREGLGAMVPSDAAMFARHLGRAREALGDDEFAAAWAEGQALTYAETVAVTATVTTLPGSPAGETARLTRRERDVLRLLSDGQTDREIAAALFLSPRTVSWHVRSVLTKLGAASRREVIARARVQSLLPS